MASGKEGEDERVKCIKAVLEETFHAVWDCGATFKDKWMVFYTDEVYVVSSPRRAYFGYWV